MRVYVYKFIYLFIQRSSQVSSILCTFNIDTNFWSQCIREHFTGVERPRHALTTQPYLAPRLRMSRAILYIPSVPAWHVTGRRLPLPLPVPLVVIYRATKTMFHPQISRRNSSTIFHQDKTKD